MSLSLTPETERRIAEQLQKGRYQSADEVIVAALALLDERERCLAELRQQIDVGAEQIDRGQVTDGEVIFDRLFNRLNQQPDEE